MHYAEILIVGAGIVGLTIARELLQRGANNIYIIDKESVPGMHASGRNSGVLHAGIYYAPETLKAKLCLSGNLQMQAYCKEKKLPLQHCGKVIVAKNENEHQTLLSLYERAKMNGADVELVDEKTLREIEPYARTYSQALYSRNTAVVDCKSIMSALYVELQQSNKVTFLLNTKFVGIQDTFSIQTDCGIICYQQLINTAGAYADIVAHHFGIGKEYCLIPFKGVYRKLITEKTHLVNGNIYPVPNLENPFLGVHFTKNIHSEVYVGPTAIPAFGRENYGILSGITSEAGMILFNEIRLFICNKQFRKVALNEPRKYLTHYFYQDAKRLIPELKQDWLERSTKSGIRPQLINLRNNKLEMDFLVVREQHTLHVLNAISPAFTSSMAFASYIADKYF